MSQAQWMSEIYQALAEGLAWPPAAWLSAPGYDWPVYGALAALAEHSGDDRWNQIVLKIAESCLTDIKARQEEYREIFHPSGGTPVSLYECQHRDGRFPGPSTFAVKNLYARAGLRVEGAEMPDHASLELAFLAYLCQQEARGGMDSAEWRAARRMFVKNHAGKWLPEVGRALLRSGSPAWQALGQVLIASLSKRPGKPLNISPVSQNSTKTCPVLIPTIEDATLCNLCGFCIQVCPTKALRMHEDEQHTELWLLPKNCIGCSKCAEVCGQAALELEPSFANQETVLLRCSDRAQCPRCGAPTVSQAELDAVADRLGEYPTWLDTCLECR